MPIQLSSESWISIGAPRIKCKDTLVLGFGKSQKDLLQGQNVSCLFTFLIHFNSSILVYS